MNDLYRRPPTRNASSTRRALLGLVLAWTGLSVASVPLRAQEQPTPPVGRVVHLWVDPHYGDDVQARANNPGINIQPNKQMPVDWFHQPSNEVLQHFPWPFHTIKGAVDWLVDQSPNNPPLPYTSTDGRYIAEYATIHLRPGRYGPRGAGMNDYFAHSGLYANGATSPNGEVFPIRVPPRVRLRGTSALNTILDAHMDPIGIIEFGKTRTLGTGMTAKSIALTGEGCLIDKVMIVGAADNGMSTMAELRTGIYLWPDLKCTPTITNCVFSFNGYGIVLDAPAGTEIWHTPVIANNTFAGNFIALWNGQRAVSQGSRGNSAPILINNIFDNSVPPNTGGLQGHVPFPFVWGTGSCFEGVDKADVTVQTPVAGDFNAYEKGRYNLGVAFWGLPVTQARNQGPAVPGVDIGPYTGASGLRRGVLYVRDLLLNGRLAGAAFNPGPPWPEFDGGGHDFRLVPAVAPADSLSFKVPGTSGALNPLVDAGIATLPLTMENQRTLAEEPGRIHLSEEAPRGRTMRGTRTAKDTPIRGSTTTRAGPRRVLRSTSAPMSSRSS